MWSKYLVDPTAAEPVGRAGQRPGVGRMTTVRSGSTAIRYTDGAAEQDLITV